jgi:hypothetical protein
MPSDIACAWPTAGASAMQMIGDEIGRACGDLSMNHLAEFGSIDEIMLEGRSF